jgi:hypothetical protein
LHGFLWSVTVVTVFFACFLEALDPLARARLAGVAVLDAYTAQGRS